MRLDTRPNPLQPTPRRPRRPQSPRYSRRGSTIIVAVGVLAVLALVAVSYALAVRTDRAAVSAYEGGVDLESSSRIVREEIGALLAADIFGNKIVTTDVPIESSFGGQKVRVWPRAFEDGEHFDVPRTAPGTFDQRTPDEQQFDFPNTSQDWVIGPQNSPAGNIPPYFPSAPNRDDAWLASSEPFNPVAPSPRDGAAHLDWTSWGQMSDLRSAYRWVRTSTSDRVGVWVRDDGRFADLGQFFRSDDAANPLRLRGDPGANLSYADDSDGVDDFTGLRNGPEIVLSAIATAGGPVNFATDVYDYQLHQLGELHSVGNINFPEFDAYDERFFTDTDGDLRADARWQVLPALDGLFGMRWVAAARIIDNSAMVNVNTAMEFQDPRDPQRAGDGRTPADVDLTRLVRSAHLAPDLRTSSLWASGDPYTLLQVPPPTVPDSVYFSADRTNDLFHPINQHLVEQLGLEGVTTTMVDAVRAPAELVWSLGSGDADSVFQPQDILGPSNGTLPQFTTRLQRYMANRYYGVSPLQPSTDQVTPYPITAEVDLRAFFGVNNNAGISKVEQRFDNLRLDTATGTLSGPLRAKELTTDARKYAVDPTAPGVVKPSVRAVATDTRRLLTTVSGEGDFSPVPVLNREAVGTRPIFDQAYNKKINFHDVPRVSPDPALAGVFQRTRRERDEIIREAFGAFAWALAPLAGHTPLMSPLNEVHTGWQLAIDHASDLSKFFYGGDAQPMRGPAYMLSTATGATADPGAAYAVLRAASLAINLADATDDDRINAFALPQNRAAPIGATSELPTVARLYNIPHPAPYEVEPGSPAMGLPPLPPTTATTDSVVRMGVSFSWGDLRDPAGTPFDDRVPASNDVLLPPEYVGDPLNGVTLAGLDRQPFLREVYTVAVYADDRALDGATGGTFDEEIDTGAGGEQVGSIIAFEVGNPWPTPIDVSRYRLLMAASDTEVLGVSIDDGSLLVDREIAPGDYAVFYAVNWRNLSTESQDYMEAFADKWKNALPEPAKVRRVGEAGDCVILDDANAVVDDAIPFQAWANGSAVGLIVIPDENPAGIKNIPGAGTIVVDRLSNSAGGGVPRKLDSVIDLDPPNDPALRWTGLIATLSSGFRATDIAAGSGFPSWVLERPTSNMAAADPGQTLIARWAYDSIGGVDQGTPEHPGSGPAAGNLGAVVAGNTGSATLSEEDKGAFPIAVPSFQLFVPDTELRYTSELLQLSAFTHMYVHAADDPDGAMLGANIANPDMSGPDTWRTVSEQLGADGEIYRDAPGNGNPNPYLGVLDPTRFVYASGAAPTGDGVLGPIPAAFNSGLPEALAVPLALRVVDCFEPLWTPDQRGGSTLVQGRININTAGEKTLRMLPLVDPFDMIGALRPQSPTNADDVRVPLILAYRDRELAPLAGPPPTIPSTPGAITQLMGINTNNPLRRANDQVEFGSFSSTSTGGLDLNRGFVTPGELAILDRWTNTGDYNALAYGGGAFGALGSNAVDDTGADLTVPALDVRREANSVDSNIRPTPMLGGSFADYEGMDDPEERLALYRAISNIVTTRSDVYTAYFKVRGYAPSDIEAIQILQNPSDPDAALADAMNELSPRFEGRYLAVFDRSNVHTPVDRPKVLLFVRLPD